MAHSSSWWHFGWAVLLLLLATWYLLENSGRRTVTSARQTAFYSALCLAAAVLIGPVAEWAFDYFWAHMVQHISLMMLISPLLVIGSPGHLLLDSRFVQIRKASHWLAKQQPIRWLFLPQVGWLLFLAVLIGTHFSPLANLGMQNQAYHALELGLFLIGGGIYYYAVLEGNPKPYPVPHSVRLISLFAMMLPETMTGFFLYASGTLLHEPHSLTNRIVDPLTDQQIGGALMWSMGMIIDSVWIAVAALDFFRAERSKADANE